MGPTKRTVIGSAMGGLHGLGFDQCCCQRGLGNLKERFSQLRVRIHKPYTVEAQTVGNPIASILKSSV